MKRDMNDLDLRGAFTPMPEECHRALMSAANSVKEEEPVKKASYRAVLIAAVIIVASMAVAFAAQQLGWVDFYQNYDGVPVPKAAEEILNATKPQSYQVGPMTFTYKQLLADGRIALSTADIVLTDGSEALYTPDMEIGESMDALSDTVLKKYGLESGTTWLEAAKQLNLPLYGVRALIEVEGQYSAGWAMEDPMWNEDGSIVFFSMPATNPETAKGVLPVTMYMAVTKYDPATGEALDNWVQREESEIAVSAMLAEKSYQFEGEVTFGGLTLTGVRAEQYVTGVYVFTSFTVPEGMSEEAATDAAYNVELCDSEGNRLPGGISLSGELKTDAFPAIVLESMISAEELPDSITLADDTTKVVVK